jgi:hypothetical protein
MLEYSWSRFAYEGVAQASRGRGKRAKGEIVAAKMLLADAPENISRFQREGSSTRPSLGTPKRLTLTLADLSLLSLGISLAHICVIRFCCLTKRLKHPTHAFSLPMPSEYL